MCQRDFECFTRITLFYSTKPILWMRRLMFTGVKELVQGYTISKLLSWDL